MIKLPPFYKIKQGEDRQPGLRRIHLWDDATWDEHGGHSVGMSMDLYEEIRTELNALRRLHNIKVKP